MLDQRQLFRFASGGVANGNSDAIVVDTLTSLTLQISEANGGTFDAQVTLWGRVHESLPFEKIQEYTASTLEVRDEKLQAVKLIITSYVSGEIVAGIAGILNTH